MRIWLDLANSPHVHILKPIATELEHRGHEIVVTLRDFAQTVELAERLDLSGPIVGRHGGATRWRKGVALASRTLELQRFAHRHNIDVAFSHNSYAQAVAARTCGIRTITMMDYEGQPANHIAFRAANVVIVPESFPSDALTRFGAKDRKIRRFPGFKEQLYLSSFQPTPIDDELQQACGSTLGQTWQERPLVVIRPPATMALYHQFENPLFPEILRWLGKQDVQVIALPRTRDQIAELEEHLPQVAIPKFAIDGPSLVARADLVISGGGTMNREAAVLGTPAYTIFAGDLPAVDLELIALGRLIALHSIDDLPSDSISFKPEAERLPSGPIVDVILDALGV